MGMLGKPPQSHENIDVHWVQSKRLIHGLGIASDDIQRRGVIKIACISFDHHRTDIHNEEIHAGAANLLYEYLYLAVLSCSSLPMSTTSSSSSTSLGGYKDIERICRIFNMLYRCSDYVAIHSFCEIGSKLLPLVLHVYQHVFPTSSSDTTLEKSNAHQRQKFKTSVELLLQRFCNLDVPLASMVDYQHLMAFLTRSISLHSPSAFPDETHIIVTPHQNDYSTLEQYQHRRRSINHWFLNRCLEVLVGLTNHPESKVVAMQQCPGLLQAIVLVAKPIANHHQLTIVQDKDTLKHRTEAIRIFSNLAWETRNKTEMVRTKTCINALVDNLEVLHTPQEEVDDPEANESAESAVTSAMKTLQYLSAAETSNKVRLVLHNKGKVVSVLMDILAKANHRINRDRSQLEKDTTTSYEDMLIVTSLETLLNLVCRETAKYIGRQQPHLFELLASYPSNTLERRIAKEKQGSNTKNSNSYHPSSSSTSPKVVNLAMQILLKFASYIQVNDSCHEQFMIAILATTTRTRTSSLFSSSSLSETVDTEQEEEEQHHHDDHYHHSYCLPPIAIAKILVYQSICGGSQTCFYMVRCNDIIQTLVRFCSRTKYPSLGRNHDNYDTVASVAMEALYNLTKQGGMMNAKKLVQHHNVLETLVNCVFSSSSSISSSCYNCNTNDHEEYSQNYCDSGDRIKCRRFAVKALLNLINTASSCSSSHIKKKKKRIPKQKSFGSSSWKDNQHDTTTTTTMIQVRCAKQMGLIASLAEYGISKDTDVRLKRAAIQGVMILTPLV